MSITEKHIFEKIFLEYHPLLFAFGKRIIQNDTIVEDCIQDLFLYIHEKNIDLSSIDNLKAYLFKSYRRLLIKRNQAESKNHSLEQESDISFQPSDFNDLKVKSAQVTSMLNSLPWRQREAVYLKYFNKLSAKEIAEIMDITPQVVANTIYKALKKLRAI